MKKRLNAHRKPGTKEQRSNSVSGILKQQRHSHADTALEIVAVYEVVERAYRTAMIAGEKRIGSVPSTND